jgi:hypothetical protein
MLDNKKIQLISKLKQQPKIGNGPTALLDELTNVFKKVFASYEAGASAVIQKNVFAFLATEVQNLTNSLTVLEQRNTSLQTGFNKNIEGAAKLGEAIDGLSGKVKVNSDKAKDYAVELRDIFAGQTKFYTENGRFGEQITKQSDQIRNQLNVSSDAYKGYIKFQGNALGRVKDFGNAAKGPDQLATNFAKVNDQIGNVALGVSGFYDGALTDLVEGMGKLDASTASTFGQMPENLALAFLKTKQLGIELNKVTGIGEGFLDIENAIASELEFQILSGEELLTQDGKSLANEAAKAALAQDANELANIFVGFIDDYGEKIKDNPLLQKQAADMFNMSKDDLLGAISQYNTAGAQSLKIFNTQLENIPKVVDAFDKAAAAEDKRTTSQINLDKSNIKYTEGLENTDTKIVNTSDVLLKTGDAIDKQAAIISKTADNPVIQAAFAGGSTLGFAKSGYETITSGKGQEMPKDERKDDLFIPAGGSGTVISGPYGSFAMNPGDDILAMPNIRQATAGGGSDASALIAALQGMSFHVTNVFDGDKIQSNLSIRQGQTLNNINQV